MVLLASDEPWPEHQKPYWKDVLKLARSKGWYLERYSAHAFGVLRCSDGPPENVCIFKVLSTGRSAENAARSCTKLIERCPHRSTTESVLDGEACLLEAAGHVAKAERLVDAAQRCLESERLQARAEELLIEATTALAMSEELLDESVQTEAAASRERAGMRGSLADFEALGQDPGVERLTHLASASLDAGEDAIATLDEQPEKLEVEARIVALRRQIDILRSV
jgi:hypothetical protein